MNEAELEAAIRGEETRLAELDRLRDEARGRLADLRMRLAATEAEKSVDAADARSAGGWSPERKVALFRELFRGREDVFPVRWENGRTGRSGYAPRCSNEWARSVCVRSRASSAGRARTKRSCPLVSGRYWPTCAVSV